MAHYGYRIVILSVAVLLVFHTYSLLGHWHTIQGYEAEWVAYAIANGHGFSFPGNHRWLFEPGDPTDYFPTAWVDPVFTYLFAASLWLFDDYGRLVVLLLNLVFSAVTILLIYQIGRSMAGHPAGLLSAALMITHWYFHPHAELNNAPLAALLISTTALLLVRFFDQPSTRGSMILGFIAGFTILTAPGAMLFLPAMALALLSASSFSKSRALFLILICVASAVAVIAPWTFRNYVTFGEVIPVRTGVGQISYVGTVALAETFMPGAEKSPITAPWIAKGPLDAMKQVRDREARNALERYQLAVLSASSLIDYEHMNEAQRDSIYFARSMTFIFENPVTFLQLAVLKAYVFATKFGALGALMLGFAVIAMFATLSDPRARALSLLLLAYAIPFSVIISYFGRYRLPIEPIVVTLAGLGLTLILRRLAPSSFQTSPADYRTSYPQPR